MWTPKRVLLLVAGFALSIAAYIVYNTFLGYVDGLPQLPAEFGFDPDAPPPVIPDRKPTPAEDRLRIAFGDDCPELQRHIKLEIVKYGIALATDNLLIENGRVRMTPFSIAIFRPERNSRFPEINTVRSDVAYLTFDQPITKLSEIGNRKIVAAELCRNADGRQEGPDAGGVRLVNNRRTPQRDDDLSLFTPGPVYYLEKIGKEADKEPHIWTAEAVRLRDEQSRPHPTEILAIGMDAYLSTDPPKKPDKPAPTPAAANKNKQLGVTGVKAIRLRSDVDMCIWTDGQASFLGDSLKKPTSKDEAAQAKPTKAQVQIKTQGPFYYDLLTDKARFDISQHPGPYPNNVVVRRTYVPDTACDQLICDHLEVQFQRKSAGKSAETDTAPADDRAVQLTIQNMHAWGGQVTVTSDLEGLTAFGNDLTHDAVTRETVIKGSPEMVVMQNGSEIYGKEMVTQTLETGSNQARVKGPGHLRVFDKATNQRSMQARWNDYLVFVKEEEFDILTLTGQAIFLDPEHNQELQAAQLRVWMLPAPTTAETTFLEGTPKSDPKRRPHHLEAVGQVRAKSAEMNVHDTDRLVVWFKDAPPGAVPLGGTAVPGPARGESGDHAAGPAKPPTAATEGASPAPEPPAKTKPPIDLSARSVEAHVIRYESKNELDKLWCEGMVRVHQDPTSPEDKGTNIHGQTLELRHFPEGHVLTVTGDTAEVQLDKMTIFGPEVNIDQKENKATVYGAGCMKMPSQTNFQGGQLAEPAELTVYWNREMFFNGQNAVFHGGVQAEQQNGRLICQTMQVELDRPVSLKEGQGKQPAAKVQRVVCDQSVRAEDSTYQDQQLLRFTQLDAMQMLVNNFEGIMTAPGPGIVRILQPGPRSESMGRPTPPPTAPEEMKLTRISYQGRMLANNTTRTAVFYDDVKLIHVPTDNPNLPVDMDKMPEGSFYLSCNLLRVYQQREASNKAYQQLEARGAGVVQAKEFWGRADVIKFDELKDLVIFEASEGNVATLYRQRARGMPHEEVKGRKIYYWRRTNDFKIEGATRLETGNTR